MAQPNYQKVFDSNRPIKTLQILGNTAFGGATKLIIDWCSYLLSRNCVVDILCTDGITINSLIKIDRVRLITHIIIPREISPIKDMIAYGSMTDLLRKNQYDIVHTYTATPGFIGRIAAKMCGVPVILHHQAGWTINEFSSLFERLLYTPMEYLAALASSKSICVSNAVAKQAIDLNVIPKDKLKVICNGIDPSPYIAQNPVQVRKELHQKLNLPERTILLGSTSRLSPQKDVECIIRAIGYLKGKSNLEYRLLLAGDGPDLNTLQTLAKSLNIIDNICFLGFRTDIPEFLAGIDIFINSSLREGLSISLLEAMAAAKPIISTSILPNAELIINEVTGLLVSPKSPEQIANAVIRYLEDRDLAEKCGREARQNVLKLYTIDRMFQETWDLYLSLLASKYENN